MFDFDFQLLLIQNIGKYFLFLIPNILILLFIMRNRIHSILDPLFIVVFFSGFANTIPFFLYDNNMISTEKFWMFIVSETMFWIGILIVKPYKVIGFDYNRQYTSPILEKRIFYIFFTYVIILKLINISIGGIAILQENRFDVYQIPMYKYLSKLQDIPTAYCFIYCFYIFSKGKGFNRRKILYCCLFFILIAFSFLTGSKSFLLSIVGFFFYYYFFYLGRKPPISPKYLIPVTLSPILVLMVSNSSDTISAFIDLLFRFVQNGDVYWHALCENTIDHIPHNSEWYQRVFSFILSPLGLNTDAARTPIGTLLIDYLYAQDLVGGANSRVPIFCYYLFQYYGWIFAFILGYISAKIMYTNFISIPYGILGTTILAGIYRISINFITDPTMASGAFVDLVIGIFTINIVGLIIDGKIMIKFRK